MKQEIKSFSRYEELRKPSKIAQSLLQRHLAQSHVILDVKLTQEEEEASGVGLHSMLDSVKGAFLLERLTALGVTTLVDLKHIAGLTTLWEYRDLLCIGMGFLTFGRNWSFMAILLSRVRKEEQDTLGNITTAPILKHGMYRDKYRRLNDTLWKPKPKKRTKMVDLDSDTNVTPAAHNTGQASTSSQEVIPREVRLLRAANMLDLPRLR